MVSCSDLIYGLSLLASIILGGSYKNVTDPTTKRAYGTGLGILITFMICGSYIIDSVLMVWGNIVIIKCCNKRYLNQLSLAYTWLYLIYMNYNMNITTIYVLWIHQVIALRLVGLACEISLAEKYKRQTDSSIPDSILPSSNLKIRHDSLPKKSPSRLNNGDLGCEPENLSTVDLISYAYFFIGLHKGPYYRWKTFNEHFKAPFGMLGSSRIISEQKLKKAFLFGLLYMVLRLQFPVQVYYENNFYHNHGTDFRYLYNIPQLLKYVLQCQVVMLLCTSVFTEACFGIYPSTTQPLPGHGPSTKFSLLNLATSTEAVALEQEYNFAMLRCFDNEKLLKGPRIKDTLRGWEMSTRYWFWAHVYKELIHANKEVRSAVSFLAWALWCGPTIQQLLMSSTMWIHLQLEHEYAKLYNTHSSMKLPWDIGFSIMRLFCLTYLTPCLILKDKAVVFRYYNSIYWVYHIVLIIIILGASVQRVMSRRAAAEEL